MPMRLSLLILAGAAGVLALADAAAQPPATPVVPAKQFPPVALPGPISIDHVGTFNGTRIAYRSVVEPIEVGDPAGRPVARLVATSYIARDAGPPRPVLFVFNGGPITATTPLHMGAFGPKRVAIPDALDADPATFRVVDNAYSPIDVADVVVFDPANTGFSRTLPGVDPKSQFSVKADGRQLAQLVIAWRRIHGRTQSPVYLVGESYGTMRAVEAADQLQKAGFPIAGIMLWGQAVNIVEYAQRPNNIVSYAVSLPTLAALGWVHNVADRKGRSFERFILDAKKYGAGEYLSVLFLGDQAPRARMEAVARRLQEFTGLPAKEFLDRRLKVTKTDYQRLLISGKLLETNDARYVLPQGTRGAPYATRWAPAAVEHFHNFLGVPDIGPYLLDAPNPPGFNAWDWGENKSPFLDWPYVGQLKSVMEQNSDFTLFVANGYFDTQTTVGAMDYLVAQSALPSDRVRTGAYWGGHMFYSVEASLKKVMNDVRAIVTHGRARRRGRDSAKMIKTGEVAQ
jgi:carboxypeptidase C (cathepsin A)